MHAERSTDLGDTTLYMLQVRFHQVSEEELDKQRKQFHTGQLSIKIEEIKFSMK